MTSGKYYRNWVSEAGRGHMGAVSAWICFLFFFIKTMTELSVDTEYVFYGIGNESLVYLCGGLGIWLGGMEFFYLFQEKKQDFYYSLPVRKGTIFWTRYIHGLLQFMIPFLLTETVCGIFQAGQDLGFTQYMAGYTIKSIFLFGMVFLVFYHMAVLAAAVAGQVVSTVLTVLGILFYFYIWIQKGLLVYAEKFFSAFYRIPILEEASVILTPFTLAGKLTGSFLYEKKEIWQYMPEGRYIIAGGIWILFLGGLGGYSHRKRKTEKTGRVFTLTAAERTAEISVSVLAGTCLGSFLLHIGKLDGCQNMVKAAVLCAVGAVAAAGIHFLIEWTVCISHRDMLRRKKQLVVEVMTVCILVLAFCCGQKSYDFFVPEPDELRGISVAVSGLDMDQEAFLISESGQENYVTDEKLQNLYLEREGAEESLKWAGKLPGEKENAVTTAVVCYHLKDGREKYRSYPIEEKELLEFSRIYETEEYKEKAFLVLKKSSLEKEKVVWSDGVMDTVLKLSPEEKRELLEIHQQDVKDLKMEDLKKSLPCGRLRIQSELRGSELRSAVYPFFTRTCGFLKERGIDPRKELKDYPVSAVKVEMHYSVPEGAMSGTAVHFYSEPAELEEWTEKLIPKVLCVQPLFHEIDSSVKADVEFENPQTEAWQKVECYGRKG